MTVWHCWIDECRKRQATKKYKQNNPDTQDFVEDVDPIDLSNLDEFEKEVVTALNEGYKPKEIAEICEMSPQMVWRVIRELKKKIK